jgi:hypothetical protein
MKLPDIMDADDWRIIVQGGIYCCIIVSVVLAFAATAGLAWAVFRMVGGV